MREEQPTASQQMPNESPWVVYLLLSIIAFAVGLALLRGLVPTQRASSGRPVATAERRMPPTIYHPSAFVKTDPIAVASPRRPVAEGLPATDYIVVQSFSPAAHGHRAVAPPEPKRISVTYVPPVVCPDSLSATALVAVVNGPQPIPTTVLPPEVLDLPQPPSATPCQPAKASILESIVSVTPIGHDPPVESACSCQLPSPTSTIAVFLLAMIGSSILWLRFSRKSGYDIRGSPRLYDKTLVATPAATKKLVDGGEDDVSVAIAHSRSQISPINLDCDVETPLTPVRTAPPQPESPEASPQDATFPSSDDTPVTTAPKPIAQNKDDDDTYTGLFSTLRVSDSLQLMRQKPKWNHPVFSRDIVSDNATYGSSTSPENLSDEGTEKCRYQMVPCQPQFVKKDTPLLDSADDIGFFDVGAADRMSTPKVAQKQRLGRYISSRSPPSLTVSLQ